MERQAFQEEEGADVAIITDRFWKARFAGSRDIIGRAIVLDGVAHTIVGVIPKMPVSWTGTERAKQSSRFWPRCFRIPPGT